MSPRAAAFMLGAVAMVLVVSGCAYRYAAPLTHETSRGEFVVRSQSLSVWNYQGVGPADDRVRARLSLLIRRAPRGARLVAAYSTNGQGVPCLGWSADGFDREDGRDLNAPLVSGETISVFFTRLGIAGQLEALTDEHAHVDLVLQTPEGDSRCVSLPITDGRRAELTAQERFTVGSDLMLEGFPSRLGPVSQFLGASLQVGYWMGSLHPEGGVALLGAGCPEPTCKSSEKDSRIDYTTSVMYFGGVRTPIYERGEFSVGAALRYRVMHLAAETVAAGRETLWAHGPVLSPYVAAVPTVRSGNDGIGGSKEMIGALEIPIGYAFADDGSRSLSAGVDLSLLFTAF